MPSFENHGARLYYEEYGQGFPILTFAPAGLASVIKVWSEPSAPINPITEFAGDFRVIAMDQRNAGGQSRAPITARDNWDSYTKDHIALLDHLRIDRCHLYGQCIGGSFILNLIKKQPERVAAAVLAQPIGRVGPMPQTRTARFEAWAASLNDHPEATPERSTRFIATCTRRDLCTAPIATLCERCGRRAWCWPETTRRTRTRSRKSWIRYCRTANSSPSGRPGRRSKRRAFGSRNSWRGTRQGSTEDATGGPARDSCGGKVLNTVSAKS